MPRLRVTNISQGPRYVHAETGSRLIQPGQYIDDDFTDGEAKNLATQVGQISLSTVGGADAKAPAKAEAVDVSNMTKAQLAAFIEKRDGKAPAADLNKAELIVIAEAAE